MMDNVFKVFKKEFFTNLLSIRLFILGSIFAIIVLGVSYGISIESIYQAERENIIWNHSIDYDGDDIEDDLVIYYTDYWGNPLKNKRIYFYDLYDEFIQVDYRNVDPVLITNTDDKGRIIIKNLTQYMHRELADSPMTDYYYIIKGFIKAESKDDSIEQIGYRYVILWTNKNMTRESVLKENFFINERMKFVNRDLEKRESMNDVIIHAVTPNGKPSKNAKLIFNNETVARANKQGIIEYEFPAGEQFFSVRDKFGSTEFSYNFLDEKKLPYQYGPDYVISSLALVLSIIIPVISIGLAYDSIAKERENNSIFFMLIKPIEQWRLALGKLTGPLLAMTIPIVTVNSISALLIWNITGKTLSLDLILVFLIGSFILLAIYLALQMIISTIAPSSGTAILGGIGIWMFFTLFFRLLKLGISSVLNLKTGSYDFEVFSNYFDLANPNFIFMKIISIFGPNPYEFAGVENWFYYISFLIWAIIPIISLLIIFEKRLIE